MGALAIDRPASAGFSLRFLGEVDGQFAEQKTSLASSWHTRLEHVRPVREFPSYPGRRGFSGLWWSSTMQDQVGFESWLERDRVMMLDFSPEVVAFSSQPFWLTWPEGTKKRRHVPDYFARLADGTGLVIDVRADDDIEPKDAEAFAATGEACQSVGWAYQRVGAVDPVLAANVRSRRLHRRIRRGRRMMTTALSGWPPASLLRPLPRTVSPAHDETLHSYLRRLASANGMKSWEFTDYVKGSRKTSDPIPPEVVITLSGQHPDSMRYAILELCSPRELGAMNVAGRPRPGHSIQEPKCIRCTGIDDIYDPVTCWRRSEDVICLRHQRWTAGGGQLDLAGHEDVVQANKQHRRLIRRHGRAAVRIAFTQASRIIEEWIHRPSYCERFHQLMHRFHGRGWSVPCSDPTVLVSCYLPAVALTRLLASPRWKALALDPAGNDAFVTEVCRTVEPSYTWNPYPYWRYVEPLARTLQREAEEPEVEAREAEFRRKYKIPDQPFRPSEVIESDDLCHDS